MPFGAPSHTVPKSGCRPALRPMLAIRLAEFGSTGCDEMSVFQGLSGGKTCLPAMEAPAPVAAGGLPVPEEDPDPRSPPEPALPPPAHPVEKRANIAAKPITAFIVSCLLLGGRPPFSPRAAARDPPE